MYYRRAYHIATVVVFIACALAIWGFGRLQSEMLGGAMSRLTVAMFFGSVLVGIIAGVCRVYWRQRYDQARTSDKIALDTLAELGRQQYQNKRKK